ncbi:methyltransferase regulatory domain-containing protein [Campylobacter sp. CX2-8023-23]|uniref:methyltransferase regulatory domain-containing protein n=1 Tax=Campylobacter porcelli TaxID=1660073 RepID=UPI002EA1C5B0|nr:methyltransferase regulatory domain-containing protein [Campylobacter sp. CX2-8023-23]
MINSDIKSTYDEHTYNSYSYAQTSVDYLCAVARFHGLAATDPYNAKVLEIGCAMGGNIIGQAINHPNSTFIGIDLSSEQIAIGKAATQGIGCKNIELIEMDICNLVSEFGGKIEFDYIICHGIYSWVPDFVRSAILQSCQKLLSPNGVAFISYNCYPGWKYVEPLRDFMRFSAVKNSGNVADLESGLNAIKFQKAFYAKYIPNESSATHIKSLNLEYINHIQKYPKSYVAHEYMEICNQPFYFLDFVADAGDNGLCYVADATYHFDPSFLPDGAISEYFKLSFDDYISANQAYDFLYSIRFRSSILTKSQNQSKLATSDYDKAKFAPNLYFKLIKPSPELLNSAKDTYIEPLAKALNEAFPATMSFDEIKAVYQKDDIVFRYYDIRTVTNNALSIACEPHKKLLYTPGKTRLKKAYEPYLRYFLDNDNSSIGIATPSNDRLNADKHTLELTLMFDGNHTIKDIQNHIKAKFEKEKLIPTIQKDGKTILLKSSKEQNEYFKNAVETIKLSLINTLMLEEY